MAQARVACLYAGKLSAEPRLRRGQTKTVSAGAEAFGGEADFFFNQLGAERLAEVVVHAAGETSFAVFVQGVGGEGDERKVAQSVKQVMRRASRATPLHFKAVIHVIENGSGRCGFI